jgi:hypothetical protein
VFLICFIIVPQTFSFLNPIKMFAELRMVGGGPPYRQPPPVSLWLSSQNDIGEQRNLLWEKYIIVSPQILTPHPISFWLETSHKPILRFASAKLRRVLLAALKEKATK